MNGVNSLSPHEADAPSSDAVPVAVGDGQMHRRKRRRKRTLGEKLKRHHAANRARRIIAILVLGAAVIGISMFAAHRANEYVPVPTFPAP